MNLDMLGWPLHRLRTDRLPALVSGKPRAGRRRLLFISVRNSISLAQIYPFWYHRADFAERHGIEILELPLERYKAAKAPCPEGVDAVCFQTWFDLTAEDMQGLVRQIQQSFPGAALGYLDWFAPTDLRYAQVLDGLVSVYIKKQLLRDRADYLKPTLGDTNLTDYYARRFDLDEPETRFAVPDGFWDKLWLSPHFAFSPDMVRRFFREFPNGRRDIDLHARIEVKGTPWYSRMRQEALDRSLALQDRHKVVCRGRVPKKEFFRELFRSRLCFSPFGYGEVCWRDFEAMFAGALLIKPDMSHLECYPEAFVPFETYVPVQWDLSDFTEKVEYYLARPEERLTITRNAFDLMQRWLKSGRFVDDAGVLFTKLGLVRT